MRKKEATEMRKNRFKPGDIVQHFKREMVTDEERSNKKYLYEIVGVAIHSETREPMMVYRPLYDEGGMFVRPLEMFLSEVDHEKYPEIHQKYRFEKVVTLSLTMITDGIENISDEWISYFDKEKVEIVSVPIEPWLFDDTEDFDELNDLLKEGLGTRFFKLPDERDVNRMGIMRQFVDDLPEGETKQFLTGEIRQRGAYRRFREGIAEYGMEQDWLDYLHEAHVRIARNWCDRNGLSYTE